MTLVLGRLRELRRQNGNDFRTSSQIQCCSMGGSSLRTWFRGLWETATFYLRCRPSLRSRNALLRYSGTSKGRSLVSTV